LKKFIYKILRYTNYLVIAALLLSYLSVYVNPAKAWFLAFFGLAYPFLLICNTLFILFWISKKKAFAIIPILAILIGWNYLSSYIQIPLKNQKKKYTETYESVKVLSFNVRLFDLYKWNNDANTVDRIFEFIESEDPDIICFQDFYTTTGNLTETEIIKKLGNKHFKHINYTIEGKEYNYGIATFSKYPIINRGSIHFSNSFNTSIYTDIVINEDTVRVFNNHLQSIRFNKNNYKFISNSKSFKDDERMKEILDISNRLRDAFIKRAGQAEIISNHIQNSPHSVFVCGDFNDAPVSYTYKTIKKGLKDSFTEAGKGIGNTYNGNFPSFRIDYILHSKNIICYRLDIEKVKLSDHYPVFGEFYLSK